MPRKRRAHIHRRISLEIELKAWSGYFECGYDFFDDLEAFGLYGDAAVEAAGPEAWKRLGAAFMETWRAKGSRDLPEAFLKFGEPNAA